MQSIKLTCLWMLLGLHALSSICHARQENPSARLSAGVDAITKRCMEDQNLPGLAVVIVQDGKTVFQKGYGAANVDSGKPVDPDTTIFRIGSISKALTLLTLTRQIDLGRIQIDDNVAKYFDGLKNPFGFKKPVTIKNILTHTTGFDQIGGSDRQIYNFNQTLSARKKSRPTLASYLRDHHLRQVTEPGSYIRYDTYGTSLAGAILEQVTTKPYAEAMHDELFRPLGMLHSAVETRAENFDNLATGYGFLNGQFVPQPYEVFVTTPASSIDATPADMGRLLEALTGQGSNSNGQLFTQATAKRIFQPQFRTHPEFVGVSHGLFESYTSRNPEFEKHVRTIGHGGSMRGFIASMTIVPDHNVGIFVVTNRAPEAGGGPVRLGPIVETIIGNIPNLPPSKLYNVPARDESRDLKEFAGNYYYGVFCHSRSNEDAARNAWPRGRPQVVTQNSGSLNIAGTEFLPRGDDVFVRHDGRRMVHFARDKDGNVSNFVYSTSKDTFEKEKRYPPYDPGKHSR